MQKSEKNRVSRIANSDWMEKWKPVLQKIKDIAKVVWKWGYRFRGAVMAVPVIIAAINLAVFNSTHLPELVGINLQANGAYETMIERGTAVSLPLLLTGICLVLTFLSRKPIFSWLVSIFSLIVPIVIYITNVFPG